MGRPDVPPTVTGNSVARMDVVVSVVPVRPEPSAMQRVNAPVHPSAVARSVVRMDVVVSVVHAPQVRAVMV